MTQLAEQRSVLDGLATADKFSPRQLEIYKALKKIPLWAKSGEYAEALNRHKIDVEKWIFLDDDGA
jgi:hypothetical protein